MSFQTALYLCYVKRKQQAMKVQDIKNALLNGTEFNVEAAGWYTVCKPAKNLFWIIIGEKNIFFNDVDSMARKVCKLLKWGA